MKTMIGTLGFVLYCFFSFLIFGKIPFHPLSAVRDSHIQGNVPSARDFDTFLARDLEAHFQKERSKPIKIQYEFLRIGPTQSGVATPKFYLWIRIFDQEKQIDEGAARIAAVEKTRFEILQFVPRSEIQKTPEVVSTLFPKPVVEKILEKIHGK